ENENEEKGVDENTEIVEKLSDKFNVIKDKDGNLDNQKINLLKKALVEILKLENDKTILSQYSESVLRDGKTKFGDLLILFINSLKNGNIVIQCDSPKDWGFTGKVILGVGNARINVHLVCKEGALSWIYFGRQVFRFSENQLKIFLLKEKAN
ncbi:MAG: hypothetical protein J6P21_03775, partial [Clostridia bacterium]|nr:hypothetical protein [Clostridia bacterium]